MIGLVVVITIILIVAFLGYLVYNFHKYKSKLYAIILKLNGNSKEIELDDPSSESFDDGDGNTYDIVKSKVFNVSWLFPKKALYYIEGMTKPIGYEAEKTEDADDDIDLGSPIYPPELNDIMRTKFVNLFATESEGFLSGFSISKKWLFLIGIVVVLLFLFVFYGGEILDLIGAGSRVVRPENTVG